jgi:hypothetical protein
MPVRKYQNIFNMAGSALGRPSRSEHKNTHSTPGLSDASSASTGLSGDIENRRSAGNFIDGRYDRRQGRCVSMRPKLVSDHATQNGGPYGEIADPKQWFSFHRTHPQIQFDFLKTMSRRSFTFRRRRLVNTVFLIEQRRAVTAGTGFSHRVAVRREF